MRPWCSGEEVCGGSDHFTCDVPDTRGMLFRSMICVGLLYVSKRNGGGEGEAYFEAKIEFWLSGWSFRELLYTERIIYTYLSMPWNCVVHTNTALLDIGIS